MIKDRRSIAAVDASTSAAWRQRWLLVLALIGAAVLAVTWLWASEGRVPGPEEVVFRWLNDSLPDGLEWLLWAPMQFGAIGAVAAVALVQLVLTRQWLPTVLTLVVGIEAWGLAKVVKPIVDRGRPGAELEDVVHRGGSIGGGIDAGLGFVSGHSAIAGALALTLTIVLPRKWRWVPWLLAAFVGLGRVYFGAHLPLDILGGYGLGLVCAGLTLAVAGLLTGAVRGRQRPEGR